MGELSSSLGHGNQGDISLGYVCMAMTDCMAMTVWQWLAIGYDWCLWASMSGGSSKSELTYVTLHHSFLQSIRGRNDCSVSESVVRGMGNSLSWVSHAWWVLLYLLGYGCDIERGLDWTCTYLVSSSGINLWTKAICSYGNNMSQCLQVGRQWESKQTLAFFISRDENMTKAIYLASSEFDQSADRVFTVDLNWTLSLFLGWAVYPGLKG